MQAPLFESDRSGREPVVRVALPVPIHSVFDYRLPEAIAENARPGQRALVPFAGRRLTGVIVEVESADASGERGPTRRLAAIDRLVDAEPVVSTEMIELLRSAAHDLLCPIGLALNHALPPGSAPRIAHRLALTTRGDSLGDSAAGAGARSGCSETNQPLR